MKHVAHLIGGPKDGATLTVPDVDDAGPQLAIIIASVQLGASPLAEDETAVAVLQYTPSLYLRSHHPDPSSTSEEQRWGYLYVPPAPSARERRP